MNCTASIHKNLVTLHKIFSFWSPRVSEAFVGLVDELPKRARGASKVSVNNVLCGMLSK